MSYLKFNKVNDRCIAVWNKDEHLANLSYIKVGGWMSWTLTDIHSPEIYFSASCLDEIRAKIKELNALTRGRR